MMYDPNDLLGAFVAPLVVILGLLLRAVILPLATALLLAAACFIVGGNYVVVRPLLFHVCRGRDLLAYIFSSLQS